MGRIEVFVVFSVRSFYLTVVSWSVRSDQLVSYSFLFEVYLKERHIVWIFAAAKLLGKFKAIVGLYALHIERKCLEHMLKKNSGRISALFSESLYISEPGVLINSCVLIESLALGIAYDAGCRDDFYINLHSLPWIEHLLIWLRNVFGVRRCLTRLPELPKHAVKPWYTSFISS